MYTVLLLSMLTASVLLSQTVNRYTDSIFLSGADTFGSCLVNTPNPDYNRTICQGYVAGSSQVTTKLLVDRVIGATDTTGKLIDPAGLISKGVVASCMDVSIVYTSAYTAALGGGPYHHTVSLNGDVVGHFRDFANYGQLAVSPKFCVPIANLRFGILQNSGPPAPGENIVTITSILDELPPAFGPADINEGIVRADAQLKINAMYPVVPVHGWRADHRWFERVLPGSSSKFTDVLESAGLQVIAGERGGIDLGREQTIEQGAARLQQALHKFVLVRFGVDHVHFIAHSKGGLYARKLLKNAAAGPLSWGPGVTYNLGAYSLTTLDTPHHGNAGADYLFPVLYGLAFPEYYFSRNFVAGLRDLSIARTELFNHMTGPAPPEFTLPISDGGSETNPARYYSTASDADIDGNGVLGTTPDLIQEWAPYGRLKANIMHLVTGGVVNIPFQTALGMVIPVLPTWTFHKNDVMVEIQRARYPDFAPLTEASSQVFAKNHSMLAKPTVAAIVVEQAIKTAQSISLSLP